MLSWNEVQEQLLEAVEMVRRMPSGGHWPFASDGPWHLMTREARAGGSWDAWRQEIEAAELAEMRNTAKTVPLTSGEVDWLESRLAWLDLVPERDRKLVLVATKHIARADRLGKRVSWRKIREELRRNRQWREVAISDRGLGMRYSRAISALTMALNGRRIAA